MQDAAIPHPRATRIYGVESAVGIHPVLQGQARLFPWFSACSFGAALGRLGGQALSHFALADTAQRDDRGELFLARRGRLGFPVLDRVLAYADERGQLRGGQSQAFAHRLQALRDETHRAVWKACGWRRGEGLRAFYQLPGFLF